MIELENVFKPKKRVFVSLTLASAVLGAMVIYMHRSNIQRIREGKEYRFGRHGKK